MRAIMSLKISLPGSLIEEEFFGFIIHIIHTYIENLAFGQSKLKIALHRSIERTKRLVRSAFLAFRVALRHSTFCRFGQK